MTVKQLREALEAFPDDYLISVDGGDGHAHLLEGTEVSFNTDEWSMTKEEWDEYVQENPSQAEGMGPFEPNGIILYAD